MMELVRQMTKLFNKTRNLIDPNYCLKIIYFVPKLFKTINVDNRFMMCLRFNIQVIAEKQRIFKFDLQLAYRTRKLFLNTSLC